MRCASRSVPRVEITSAWVSPRVNSAEPWVRGSTLLRISMGRTVRGVAAVDARLARQNLRTHDARFDVEQHVVHLHAVELHALLGQRGLGGSVGFAAGLRAQLACCGFGRRRAAGLRPARSPWRSGLRPWPRAAQSHTGLPASRTSSWMALMAIWLCSWPYTTAPSITSSGSCSASDSTISTAASVPATTRSIWLFLRAVWPGFSTYSPLT